MSKEQHTQGKVFYQRALPVPYRTRFDNHNDEGNNGYTIVYGNKEEDDEYFIVSAEDTEEDANEACRRLNSIVNPLLAENAKLKEDVDKRNAFIDKLAQESAGHEARVRELETVNAQLRHQVQNDAKKNRELQSTVSDLREALKPLVYYGNIHTVTGVVHPEFPSHYDAVKSATAALAKSEPKA